MATAIHQYEDKLLDFAYGELPAPEASAVESHVKSCPRCTQALEQIRGVRVSMSALPQEPAPTTGLESLLAYAEQAARRASAVPRAAAPWWKRMVAPLAGASALALVAVVAYRSQDEVGFKSKGDVALEATRQREAPPPAVAVAPDENVAQGNAVDFKGGKAAGGSRATDDSERAAKEDRNWDNNKLAKNNFDQRYGETQAPAEEKQVQRRDLGSAIGTASKKSETRRVANKDMPSNNDNEGKDDLYDRANDKKKVAELDSKPGAKPPPADDAKGGYVAQKEQEKKPEKAEAPKSALANEPAKPSPYGISSGAIDGLRTAPSAQPRAEAAPAPVVAANIPPPPPSQAPAPSLGLQLSPSSSGGPGRSKGAYKSILRGSTSSQGDEDVVAAQQEERKGNAESLKRDAELEAKGYLEGARAASNNSDLQGEVKLSLKVVESNVKGNIRVEALSRLCTALEALGNEDAADKYCDLLLREFPNSSAAKLVAQRRNRVQRAAPPKAAMRKSSDELERAEKPAEPSGESPTKAKKASQIIDAY